MRMNTIGKVLAAGASLVAVAGSARATWSILIIDTRTGEIGVASATCLTGFDLRANTPVLIPGVGAATAQSAVDSTGQNRVKIRDLLVQGLDPNAIIDTLAGFDTAHQSRQYGIADTLGRTATFTGLGAGAWAGGRVGQIGDLVYAVQGNVLAGEPVVAAAVQAIIDTPGDIAEKMMASMEAARSMGGDGRCSCSGGNPTGCGAPPPVFTKSAHIAYMLIARAGDNAGCNGLIRAGTRPYDAVIGDVNGDGRDDIVTCSESTVVVLANAREPGDAFVTFAAPAMFGGGADTRGVAIADITGDGILDIVSAAYGADTVGVHAGNGDGTFGAVVTSAAGDGARGIATGDFNGDGRIDVVCSNQISNDVSIYLNEGGSLGAQVRRSVGTAPSAIVAGDLDADGDVDIAVLTNSSRRVAILRNDGSGVFSLSASVLVGNSPTDMCMADLDGDGDLDLATSDRDSDALSILTNNGAASFTRSALATPDSPTRVRAADMNGDGRLDLVVTSSSLRRAQVLEGDGVGGFVLGSTFSVNDSLLDVEVADLNLDGTPDLVGVGGGNLSIITVESIAPGVWNDGTGCATGEYFMNFNVANTTSGDPEPVYTLRAMFDAWRGVLDGRTDAVRSGVAFSAPSLPVRGRITATIELIDWNGEPVAFEPGMVTVEHAEGSAGLASIGPVVALGGGVYRVDLTGPESATGVDRLDVIAHDDLRAVVLMPTAIVPIIASPADFDGSGSVDILDFLGFFDAFGSGDLSADLTGDGTLDEQDVALFLAAFDA